MAYKRRFENTSIRLTGAPVAAVIAKTFRAPAPGRVVAVRALRTGGAGAVVNARVNADNVLAANLTAGNDVWASGTPTTAAQGVFAAGDTVALQVVSGDATLVVIQADIDFDQTAYETA